MATSTIPTTKKTEVKSETPNVMTPKTEEHNHDNKYVILWMPILASMLIVLSYLYCHFSGLQPNIYREIATLGISGIFAAICWYKMR